MNRKSTKKIKGHKWQLAKALPVPSLAEVRDIIQDEIYLNARSSREMDGVIRDPDFMHRINCLTQALKLLPKP